MRWFALVFLAACGGAAPVAPATPVAPAPETHAMKSTVPATIAEGDVELGCLGWSQSEDAAACITGEMGTSGNSATLSAGSVLVDLDETIDEKTAATLNEQLTQLGYVQFANEPTELPPDKKLAIGKATIMFTSAETDGGGENIAPTWKTTLMLTCDGKTSELFAREDEGREYSAQVRKIGAEVLIELTSHLGREGEYSSGFDTVVVNTATCE